MVNAFLTIHPHWDESSVLSDYIDLLREKKQLLPDISISYDSSPVIEFGFSEFILLPSQHT